MYSLYRAWLMRDAVAAASFSNPPDIILQVGNDHGRCEASTSVTRTQYNFVQQFAAHRAVVAAHSGYLKALLPTATGTTASISIPNVSPDVFAPLLTFMYTGYLDITEENIYEVLLATHLLHMPRALDLCRAYLVRNQQPPLVQSRPPSPPIVNIPSLPTLVKPIPSRKMLPILLGFENFQPSTSFWQTPYAIPSTHAPPLMLPTAENSPFQSVISSPVIATQNNVTGSGADFTKTTVMLEKTLRPQKTPSPPGKVKPAFLPVSPPSPPTTTSPCLSTSSLNSEECTVVRLSPVDNRPEKTTKPKCKVASKETNKKNRPNEENRNNKVVIDIACCDGPVRFRRVLNDNYRLITTDNIVGNTSEKPVQNNYKSNGEISNFSENSTTKINNGECGISAVQIQNTCELFKSEKFDLLNKKLIIDSEKMSNMCKVKVHTSQTQVNTEKASNVSESDDASSGEGRLSTSTKKSTNNTSFDSIYTCVYCNHTFKSHYCYQKHAKRHINPVTIDMNHLSGICTKPEESKTNDDGKPLREVRLLDMNVQYYPCKVCGSKFPSYYFVHKHRKMCHVNEESQSVLDGEEFEENKA